MVRRHSPRSPAQLDARTRQTRIHSYGRLCKPGSTCIAEKANNNIHEEPQGHVQKTSAVQTFNRPTKRKAPSSDCDLLSDEANGGHCKILHSKRPRLEPVNNLCTAKISRHGFKSNFTNVQGLPSPETTPTKPTGVRDCLSGSDEQITRLKSAPIGDSPILNSCKEQVIDKDLPGELLDLIHLLRAFLKSLSLKFAHNSASAPIDIHDLAECMSKVWRKRRVTTLDIRRTLGILNTASENEPCGIQQSRFWTGMTLFDYGNGRICVEGDGAAKDGAVLTRRLDENLILDLFETRLQLRWASWRKNDTDPDSDNEPCLIAEFISQLPLAKTPLHPSVKNAMPLMKEGQRRLADLKLAARSSAPSTPMHRSSSRMTPPSTTTTASGSRKEGLLQRIKGKEAVHRDLLSSIPTKESAARRAALHRLPDIIAMLSALSGTGRDFTSARHTISLQSLVQRIQDSSRSPLAQEEIERCLRLLVDECATKWMRMVAIGGTVMGVVLDAHSKPDSAELEMWRQEALAAC